MRPILILHGWGSCAQNWQRVREGLERGGCKVFLPDLPGFGGNSPLTEAWSIDDYANWLKEYCEKNQLSQFFLLGHSFGGAIAVKYVLELESRVKKLVLVSPALIRVKSLKTKILFKISKFLKIFSFLPFYCLARRGFHRFIVKSDYLATEGAMGATRETYLKAIKEDLSHSLVNVILPTVLIWGEKDSFTPFKDSRLVKEKILGSELKTLSDIGHNPHIENPELLAKIVLESL